MRLFIFESSLHGHRIDYLVLLIDAALSHNHEVCVCCPKKESEVERLKNRLGEDASKVLFFSVIGEHDNCLRDWYRFWMLYKYSRRFKSEQVLVPSADGLELVTLIASSFGFLLPRATTLGILRFRSSSLKPSTWKDHAVHYLHKGTFRFLKRVRFVVFDRFAFSELKAKETNSYSNVFVTGDPVKDIKLAGDELSSQREKFKLPHDRVVIGVFGYLDERKLCTELLDAVNDSKEASKICLLFAGAIHPRVREYFKAWQSRDASKSIQLIVHEGYLNESILQYYFNAVDIIWAGYRFHKGPSGILLHAISAQKTAIAMNFGWMGEIIKTYGCGHTFPAEISKQSIIEAIEEGIKKRRTISDENRCALLSAHSNEQFSSVLLGA